MTRSNILALLLLLMGVTATNACRSEERAPEQAAEPEQIPFDKEGTLTFIRGGEELATIDIEVAATDSARARGLMQRTSLPDQSGMLFLFDREEEQTFWMANTQLALDIFFVNADSEIVNIAKYTRPLSPESVSSIEPAQYVVETPAGFADRYGIVETDRVRWNIAGEP